jgi:hypothetical protein
MLYHAVIDLESFYSKKRKITIGDLGAFNYLAHPEVEVYLLSYTSTRGEWWVGPPDEFDFDILREQIVWAHNAAFDLTYFLVHRIPLPAEYNCSANLASFAGADRALDDAALKLLGIKISKKEREQMDGRHWSDLTLSEHEEMKSYCVRDSRTSLAIVEKFYDRWPADERALSRLTVDMALYGLPINFKILEQNRDRAEEVFSEARERIEWDNPLSRESMIAACHIAGIEPPRKADGKITFQQKNPVFKRWLAEHLEKVPWVRDVYNFRRGNQLFKKAQKMVDRIMPGTTRTRVDMFYMGAHSGRWSAAGGVNTQNMERDPWEGIWLRGCVQPEDGYVLWVADLSQIEPRTLAWLCGDHELLEKVRQGWLIYEAQAQAWGLWSGEKGTLKSNPELAELYLQVKMCNLGCGFGMAGPRFADTVETQTGEQLEPAEARRLVQMYKDANPLVVAFWNKCDQELRAAARGDGNLEYTLPSGRTMRYSNIHWERRLTPLRSGYSAECIGRKGRMHIWGGTICENLTQAVARDVFAGGLLRLTRSGRRIIGHVHDEVIAQIPTPACGGCNRCSICKPLKAELEVLFAKLPDWALDLPVACESIFTTHYRKP